MAEFTLTVGASELTWEWDKWEPDFLKNVLKKIIFLHVLGSLFIVSCSGLCYHPISSRFSFLFFYGKFICFYEVYCF